MKKGIHIGFIFLSLALSASGQIHMTPFIGLNRTQLINQVGRTNFLFGGIEMEGRLKPHKIRPIHLSLVTGATYLANGYYANNMYSFPPYYTSEMTDLSTRYLQIPLVARINWQPFPLLEDFHLFFGVGLSYNILLKATLSEKSTEIEDQYAMGEPVLPYQTIQYSDSQDITNLGVRQSLFYRFEFGVYVRRVQVAVRISAATKDMYYKGLENIWKVPPSSSGYITMHNNFGALLETYFELTMGYRLF